MATVYEVITARLVEQLEAGAAPWNKPWAAGAGAEALPRNLISGKPYRGINTWLLMAAGYARPWFLTFNQARELGGTVRKGEHGLPVVFWKLDAGKAKGKGKAEGKAEGEDTTGAADGTRFNGRRVMCRYYTVFNVDQCEGLRVQPAAPVDAPSAPKFNPIDAAEGIVNGWTARPEIRHGGGVACYTPFFDTVRMPAPESFTSTEFYYSTLFHELGHSTGHEKRLARPGVVECKGFGSAVYSREELVAEMTAAYLCGLSGISNAQTEQNSAAYLQSWIKVLKGDARLALVAAGQAQKAADLILGTAAPSAQPDTGATADPDPGAELDPGAVELADLVEA